MYQYTAPSTVLLALRQRFQVAGSIRVKGSRMGTRFPHSHIHTMSMRTVFSESVRNTNHPRSVICGRMISHFDAFRKYDFSSQVERNACMAFSCSALPSASSVVAIHQLSIYWPASSLYCSRNGAKSFRMVLWKNAGALHIPKYMTSGMYVPWRVWIAALCQSSLARQMLLYP